MNYDAVQPVDFLHLLFDPIPNGFLEVLYLIPDGLHHYPKTVVQWREMPLGDIDPAMPNVKVKNQQGYSCYFAPAIRNRMYKREQRVSEKTGKTFWMYPRGKAKDACWITALWADIDGKDTPDGKARLINSLIPPSILVSSGGGFHAYWLLERPLAITDNNRSEIMQTLKGIALYHQADTKVADLARVMRLPGTINTKPERGGAMCEIVDVIPGRYYYSDLMLTYAPFAAPKVHAYTRNLNLPADKHIPKWIEAYLTNGEREGSRNTTLYTHARTLLDNGFSAGEMDNLLRPRAAADGLSEDEITTTLNSAIRAPRGNPTLPRYMNARMGASDKRLSLK